MIVFLLRTHLYLMKKRMSDLSEQEKIHTLDALYTAASRVRGRGPMKLFLRDLLTESERVMLGRRIIIARLLLQGETLDSIRERTGAGFNTISRVQVWLRDQLPGYEAAITGLESELNRRSAHARQETSMIGRLKKRYPLHFLLFPAPRRKNT
jgi:uncharacterized protein YerC